MTTIGLVANVYNEANALPGWLETHLPFFNDVRVLHAGPGGAHSDDGTMEILEKWRVPVAFADISEGFGVVRSRALRMSPCDWVMLLDADERFYATHRVLFCEGRGTPQHEADWILQSYDYRGVNLPNWENIDRLGADLCVTPGAVYDQGSMLRTIISSGAYDAVVTCRRHWHDLAMRRPTQSWHEHPDWQLRCVRNDPAIHFDPATRMHERLCGAERLYRANELDGPFFEHFHFHFKKLEERQRAHDIMIYDAIHAGNRAPTREEFDKCRPS